MVLDLEEEEKNRIYEGGKGTWPPPSTEIYQPSFKCGKKRKSRIDTDYPCLLLQEGPCHDPLPVVILLAALE